MPVHVSARGARLLLALAVVVLAIVGVLVGLALREPPRDDAVLDPHASDSGRHATLDLPGVDAARPEPLLDEGAATPADAPGAEAPAWPAGVVEARLQGRVVDARGAPYVGAEVVFVPDAPTTEALGDLPGGRPRPGDDGFVGLPRTTCGDDGRFVLAGPWLERAHPTADRRRAPPDPVLAVTAPGMAWQGHAVTAFGGGTLDVGDLVLAQPGASLLLRALDERGAPVVGARLVTTSMSYQGPADDDPAPPMRLTFHTLGATGADGRLRLDHRWPSNLRFELRKDGYAPAALAASLALGAVADLGDVVLARGGALAGRVLDAARRPVAGAEVFLATEFAAASVRARDASFDAALALAHAWHDDRPRATSDADGAFVLGGLDEHDARGALVVTAPGHRAAWRDGLALGDAALELVLDEGASVDVDVRDLAGGEPIAGATIAARGRTGFPEGGPDAWRVPPFVPLPVEGARVLDVGALGARVFVSAPGRVPVVVESGPLAAGERRALRVGLAPGATLAGRVVDDLGAPIAGALVRLSPADLVDDRTWDGRDDLSDADGRFAFDALPAIPFTVVATHEGHAREDAGEVDPAQPPSDWTLVLVRAARIEGTLVEASGAPAVGAWISAQRAFTDGSGGAENAVTRVTRDGRFALVDLRPGAWTLEVGTGRPERLELAPGERVELSLRLPPRPRVSGRTASGAEPLERVHVQAQRVDDDGNPTGAGVSTRSGSGGCWELSLPSAGEYAFTFALADGPSQQRRLTVRPGDAPVLDVDFGTGRIAGRVLVDGSEPSGTRVRCSVADAETYRGSPPVDPQGRFAFGPLDPGTYVLQFEGDRVLSRTVRVELLPGQVRDDLEVRLAAGATLRGRVRAADGSPWSGFLHLRRTDGADDYAVLEVDDGEIWGEPLPAGAWRLDAVDFEEPLLGVGAGRRGEPGVGLPRLAERRFELGPGETHELDLVLEAGDG